MNDRREGIAMSSTPQLTLLRASNYRRMPWKNGGGETVEIVVSPAEAGLGDFHWRVSMATVATDGPFSNFPGIDRTLSILDGAGMTLFIEGRDPILLTRDSKPLPFASDAATSATLVDGPITDLNVMTQRDKVSHRVERIAVDGSAALTLDAATWLLLVDHGELGCTIDSAESRLSTRDCLIVREASGQRLMLSGKGVAYAIGIHEN
jgi:environmental stress-induced protein Ves